MNFQKLRKKKAFTLAELLVVIGIIGILFVVLISKVDFATDRAKMTGVQTDFRSFQHAFETVARENQGFDSLVKADDKLLSTSDSDKHAEKYKALLDAINKDLDPKLKLCVFDATVTGDNVAGTANIAEYGKGATKYDPEDTAAACIFVTISAKDPWKEAYIVYYRPGQIDAKGSLHGNRGSLTVISKGPNLDEESVWVNTVDEATTKYDDTEGLICDTAKTTEGATNIADLGDGKLFTTGKYMKDVKAADDKADDLSMTVTYSFMKGYGEILHITEGFSNNQTED